ncbi:MAG: type II secretion system protein GspJ [Solirubrobacterales bacterium]
MTTLRHNGFTLAEVLVASTISGFIAIVAVGAMNAITRTSQTVNRVSEVNAEIRFAARMIAQDLANLYRDANADNIKFIGVSQISETGGPPRLAFYTVGRAKARADQPEGDVYEVEYFLGSREEEESGPAASGSEEENNVLFRRLWPNPDKDREPRGVMTPIAENIGVFYLRFYDGQEWKGEWTEETKTLPKLVEVTIGTATPEKGDPVLETFTVAFPRMAEMSSQGQSSEGGQESGSDRSGDQSGSNDQGNQNQGNQNQGPQGQ